MTLVEPETRLAVEIEETTQIKPYLQPSLIMAFPWRCESLRRFHCHALELRYIPQLARQLNIPPVFVRDDITRRDSNASTQHCWSSLGWLFVLHSVWSPFPQLFLRRYTVAVISPYDYVSPISSRLMSRCRSWSWQCSLGGGPNRSTL